MSERKRKETAESEETDASPAEVAIDATPPPQGEPTVIEASALEDLPEPEPEAKPGKDERRIVYRGLADTFELGGRIYRPDQPVIVPSDVAEELLTYPNETFEAIEE